jgi:RNA polymerase sigma factor (sigma-70 family)
MKDRFSTPVHGYNCFNLDALFSDLGALLETLYVESGAARWGISTGRFRDAIEIGVRKRFSSAPTPAELQQYLGTLHLQDLALACACADGIEPAWEHFVATYRGYLYAAAAAVIGRAREDAYVREFADSIYATLYGKTTADGRTSLFKYFYGRSKLSTWLRAVLAQRYVDVIRSEKKFDSLDDDSGHETPTPGQSNRAPEPADPNRSYYLRLLADALRQAISSLAAADRARLYAYYFEERTLAEIASQEQEHEATASRKLERLRGQLKQHVMQILREGKTSGAGMSPGMDDAQIQLCLQYALEQWPFDLAGVLRSMKVARMPRSKSPESS